jgi:hypothetical protein
VKRCGKSAPRVRQRNRHGKPHREQDRIGTATRECSLKGDNTAGRCLARRPGRLLEATCKRCPRGMAVTYRLRKQAVPYKTRLTGRLISQNEGFGAARRTPRQFEDSVPGSSEGSDLRSAIAHRGISRFRVRSFSARRRLLEQFRSAVANVSRRRIILLRAQRHTAGDTDAQHIHPAFVKIEQV